MRMGKRWVVRALALPGCLACMPMSVLAQDGEWRPQKNVEIVVATSPGGGQDKTARLVQKILQERKFVEAPMSVVNKPGGGGAIGWGYLNQHPGDGHYLEIGNPTLLTNHIVGRFAFTYTDVTPIAVLFTESVAYSVPANSPIKTGRDLIERLKKDVSSVSVSIGTSTGSTNHIGIALVARAAGADPKKLKTVVFQSGGDAMTAVLGGHVDLVSSAANNVVPHVDAGRLRVIAVSSPQRLGGALASVPTWKEMGANVLVTNWRMAAGPRGLTAAQVAYWENAFGRLVQADEWKKDLERNSFEDSFMRGDEFRRFIRSEYDSFRSVLAELGMAKQ